MTLFKLYIGDCLKRLRMMPDNSVDAIVTDPPYGILFMGNHWDYDVPSVEIWLECLRVLKPGGYLLSFAGTRTQHRMAVRIEDAGFEIRDMIAWIYGNGFPKSVNVSKSFDKAAGKRGAVVGLVKYHGSNASGGRGGQNRNSYQASTIGAINWEGWGTALKPSLEPITVARKPVQGTIIQNISTYGTGAININDCRINGQRWPANVMLDEVAAELLDQQTGTLRSGSGNYTRRTDNKIFGKSNASEFKGYGDKGGASRFFYCAKATKQDRDEGLEHFALKSAGFKNASGRGLSRNDAYKEVKRRNNHPTVKPTPLMRYLCRLVTPVGGVVLDPFMGSGSTGKAAILEGFRFIGIEQEEESFDIARARVRYAQIKLTESII